MSDDLRDVVNDACELIRRAGARRQGRLRVSPEVADLLNRVEPRSAASPGAVSCSAVDLSSVRASEQADLFGRVEPRVAAQLGGLSCSDMDLSAVNTLEELERVVRECKNCPLAATRTQTVFGSGSPHAKLVFVGEAPGQDEDRQGKPFVGRAGQLLTDIIEKGMKLKRSDVYICNVLKCRPPENRNPLPGEVDLCEPFLIRQLEIIRPRVICALGTYAAQTLLKTTETIGRLRGKWHFYHGIPLRATYHPAYLLRSPAEKRKTWMDVLEVLKVYNGEFTPEPE